MNVNAKRLNKILAYAAMHIKGDPSYLNEFCPGMLGKIIFKKNHTMKFPH